MPISSEGENKKEKGEGILSRYDALSKEYDNILILSQKILNQVEKENPSTQTIVSQLKEKLEIVKRISELTNQIYTAQIEKKEISSAEVLSQGKKFIEELKAKAEELLLIENKIEELLKKKGIKIR